MLRTKIVCTIGPASQDPATLAALMRAGMDVARLNMSHGVHDLHRENVRRIRQLAEEAGKPVAILADLQGPKLRVGIMPPEGVPLVAGQKLVLSAAPIAAEPGLVPVQYEHLPESVKAGDRILIDDGLIELRVIDVEGSEIETQVVTEGTPKSNKGLNLPRASLSIPAITEKDREDLQFALEAQVDAVALSFVRSAAEVLDLKDQIRALSPQGHSTAPWNGAVIAKIEKPEAVDNIGEVITAADGIMLARGDLGIEMSTEAVPMVQKMIIRKRNQAGKPVITATQMLDSMIHNPRPARAEASDVANAILDAPMRSCSPAKRQPASILC
jgi:pyruvate kinase